MPNRPERNEVEMIVTAMREREKGVIWGATAYCRAVNVPQLSLSPRGGERVARREASSRVRGCH
jgi:hypothetical protein